MVHVPVGRRPSGRRSLKAPIAPERSFSDLASEDPRWERLLCDPDNMFCGFECVGGEYQQYLKDVVVVMEDYDCCFREAVVLAAKLDAEEGAKPAPVSEVRPRASDAAARGRERAGVADFLRARREGLPMHKALVFNMKAAALGPARAELCAWRRQEGRGAITECQAAVTLVSSSLAKGRRCSDQELVELGASLKSASELCHKLDYALEILEANSRACGEGDEALGEYSQLFSDGADCVSGARRTTERLAAVRRSKYPMEHVLSSLSEACARVCGGCPKKKARRPAVSPPTTPSPRK